MELQAKINKGEKLKKFITIAVSAGVGMVIGMTGIAGASAAPGLGSAKPKFTQSQMNKCAGAVLHGSEIIDGGDKSKAAKKTWEKSRNACEKVVGGF